MLLVKLGVLSLSALAGRSATQQPPTESLEDWLERQEAIALSGILANIGPNGSRVPRAFKGVVVASPSTAEPDYFYTWTRDAALTVKTLIDRFIRTQDPQLEPYIEAYIEAQETLMTTVDNPSGNASTAGLGEPKFHVNLTAFTEDWGRPQLDGPALRFTAMATWANYLLRNGRNATVTDYIWPLMEKDLQHMLNYRNTSGFDLWEEVKGQSFFTIAAQQRALFEAWLLQRYLGRSCPECYSASSELFYRMGDMWKGDEGYIRADNPDDETLNRSGKGANTILAVIHRSDLICAIGQDSGFAPCSSQALSNLKVVVDSVRFYPINGNSTKTQAVAIGRYPEDVYYNGNPWYLTTCAAAEQLYHSLNYWDKEGIIHIDEISLPFFRDFVSGMKPGRYSKSGIDGKFHVLVVKIRGYADEFLRIVQRFTPEDGSMAEQFGKDDGRPLSARHLTWSYAALLSAKAARDGHVPPGWDGDLEQ